MSLNTEIKKESKKELFSYLDKLRSEINSLNKDLNRFNSEKESWFRKKEDFSKNIRNKITDTKENRNKRDTLTKQVRELKEKRRNFNEGAKKKISEVVKLKDTVNNLTKKAKVKDPLKIKGDIDRLEVKLETEAMPFEKEKELAKNLKMMKKSLGDASEVIGILKKTKKFDSEINNARKNTHKTHNEIQKIASESQVMHEGIIKNSKEIDGLKTREGEAFRNFAKFKKNFNDVNNKLKEKLSEMNKVRGKINKFKLEEDEKRKLKETTLIKSKEQEVEEKIKTGKKLTTDDFLMFQEAIKNKND
jgi:uncharacterized coiled-coil DUF342 family protein|tara:strand:- start:237 stop:1148 length:912 start_codon:yes stop_codon:yes gene_type:complete